MAEVDDSVPPGALPDGTDAYRSTGKGNKVAENSQSRLAEGVCGR